MAGHPLRYRGAVRLVRGAAVAAAVLIISVAAHTASGSSLHPGMFALLFPLAFVLSTSVADRERSAAWIFAYCLGVQALFHVRPAASGSHGTAVGIAPSARMAAGHVAASAAAAMVLRHGDAALARWARFVGSLAGRPPRTQALIVPSATTVHRTRERMDNPHTAVVSGVTRRGPPIPALPALHA